MNEPTMMVCEGSGCPTHQTVFNGRVCSMCGATVETNGGIAVLHARRDILADLERGDFDE